MKKRSSIFIALVIILTASLACNLGRIDPSTGAGQKPTVGSVETNLTATTAPSTEVGQEPTAGSVQTNPTATTVLTQEAVAVDGTAGPETIDLTNPALYISFKTPAYKFDGATKFTGVDTNKSPKEVSLLFTEETQSLPKKSRHFLVEVIGGNGSAETVVIGDQVYTVFEGVCYPSPLSSVEIPAKDWPKLQDVIKGQAKRVESGVEVNGFVTDKYKLTSENMVAEDELISAFVYVARESGFITLFELQGRSKTGFQGLDPNQFTDVSIAYHYNSVKDGSFEIAIPAVCENPAAPAGGSPNPTGLLAEFPVMNGAKASLIGNESVFYQI